MIDKEKKIKEERTSLAISKNYMGLDGKFGTILKYLGKPVLAQGSSNYEVTDWQDVYDIEEYSLPEEDLDAPIQEIGRIFDGLKFGYHLEITYMKTGSVPININEYEIRHEQASRVLKVAWKGYLVYVEAEGDLFIFTPTADWEDVINRIYESARKLQITYRQDAVEEMHLEATNRKLSFLQKLRERWGI